jgi:hypothetical protein
MHGNGDLKMGATSATLVAPERINYFYGLLLDADRLVQEQTYFNQKRWMLNRLGLGSGLVCGLAISADPGNAAALALQPGVAIDLAGREIVVPGVVNIDASQLTDDSGNATGPAPAGSTIVVSLAYAESRIDAAPVLVADCDHPGNCAPATVQEGFSVLVRVASGPPPPPPGSSLAGVLPTGRALEEYLANLVGTACSGIPSDASLPLARLTLPSGPFDAVADRSFVYSNPLLFGLLLAVIDRINTLSGELLLYISGDNQSAPANTTLPNPLVVALQDGGGNPIDGGTVQFIVTKGGGSVAATSPLGNGQYQALWTLGASGAQTVIAKAVGTYLSVTFEGHIQ